MTAADGPLHALRPRGRRRTPVRRRRAPSVAVGLLALAFGFVVLFAMSFVGTRPAGLSPLARLRRPRADAGPDAKEPSA